MKKKTTAKKRQATKPAKKKEVNKKKSNAPTNKSSKQKTVSTKNNSAKKKPVPIGRTVMVRNGHINKHSDTPNERRTHVVIETNQDDLALVRLTTPKPNTTQLKGYKDGKSYFKHFVEIQDIKGNPLRVGVDISQNHENMDVSKDDVDFMKNKIRTSKERDSYIKNINKFRNRYKKEKPTKP